MSCRSGALTAGGGHFVGYWASHRRSRWSPMKLPGDQREQPSEACTVRSYPPHAVSGPVRQDSSGRRFSVVVRV